MANIGRKKVFIIGLDGGTWDVFKPMMEAGIMPNLLRLVEKGTSGVLRSTIPPITASAWTSFQTGVSPGKHGIIDSQTFNPETKEVLLVNSNSIKLKTIWDIVGENNKEVITINVPLTYPPKRINGIVVGGMLSPEVSPDFIYPPELYDLLKENDYKIAPCPVAKKASLGLEQFINEQIKIERNRFELAEILMEKYNWNLFMVHNQSMDTVQHAFYPYLISNSKEFDMEKYMRISKFYKTTDNLIGKLVKKLDKEIPVIVLSDHGFKEARKFINLSGWLKRKGYVKFSKKRYLASLIDLIRRLDVFRLRRILLTKMKDATLGTTLAKINNWSIDWDKTSAYIPYGSIFAHVYINEIKDKSGKIMNYLIDDLSSFIDPSTGERVIKKIYKTEEIYGNNSRHSFPHLFLEPENSYSFAAAVLKDQAIFYEQDICYSIVGGHDMDGIFIINGNNIKSGFEASGSIVDLAPTVLTLLGIDVPNYMEGKVLEEIFIKKPSIRFSSISAESSQIESYYTDRDKEIIRKRLEELGYL